MIIAHSPNGRIYSPNAFVLSPEAILIDNACNDLIMKSVHTPITNATNAAQVLLNTLVNTA